MARPLLIGLAGKARSGKDTVGAYLDRHGFSSTAFAAPLKAGVRAMFNLTHDHTDGHLKEEVIPHLGVSPRQLMQWLGTEYGREMIRESVWVDVALKQWRDMCEHTPSARLVVTDIRFDNEADAIRQAGGTVVHIRRGSAQPVSAHASEAGVEMVTGDYEIDNNGTLEQLYDEVDILLHVLET